MDRLITPELLRQERRAVAACKPDEQGIEFSISNWNRHFEQDPEVSELCDQFGPSHTGESDGYITRGDVRSMAGQAVAGQANGSARKRLLIATFMWGYGRRGGRSYTNAKRVMHDMTATDRVLGASIDDLSGGDISAAYLRFPLPGYGEAFFTKYLYFIGTVTHPNRSDGRPVPLIYDRQIRDRIWYMRTILKEPSVEDWASDDVGEYLDYCSTFSTWAENLGVTVDQLETYLFDLTLDDPLERLLRVAGAADYLLETEKTTALEQALRDLPPYLRNALRRHRQDS